MAVSFTASGRISGGSFDLPAGPLSLSVVATGAGLRIAVADYGQARTDALAAAGGGLSRVGQTDWHSGDTRVALAVHTHAGSLPQAVIDTALAHLAAGGGAAQSAYLRPGALAADRASVVAADTEGGAVLYVAPADGAGITRFRLDGDGRPGNAGATSDSGTRHLQKVADMAVVTTSGGSYLYAGSAREHGISGFEIGNVGQLRGVIDLDHRDGLAIQTVSALATAEVLGRDYLVVGASGSSSLTILEVRANGTLRPTDQVIDTRDMRFQGVGVVETVTIGGHVFVLASGTDEGVTLFRLIPGGRLVHEATLAEAGSGALRDILALAALPSATGAVVVTRAEGQTGAGRFTLDLGPAGTVASVAKGTLTGTPRADLLSAGTGDATVSGGAGNDMIVDGRGSDRLQGGPGRDTFVLGADGTADRILDLAPREDRIDLSAWRFLNTLDQIRIAQTSNGATLRFGDEELRIVTASGVPLTRADLASVVRIETHHVPVGLGPVQQAAPPPDPDPFPDTVPPPLMPPSAGAPPEPGRVEGVRIEGTDRGELFVGTEGDDTLLGRGGADTLRGAGGNDLLAGANGHDRAEGGDGRDMMGGGSGNDTLVGGAGRDTLGGGEGNDLLEGGDDDDVIGAGAGNDRIDGGDGADTIGAGYGHDTVRGGWGNDDLGGGTGRDTLFGGAGHDRVGAGEGDDVVDGQGGDDFLAGGGRDDRLAGGPGADTLNGGGGNDTLAGGTGPDVFVFAVTTAAERDVILDFEPGADTLFVRGLPGAGHAGKYAALDIVAAGAGTLVSHADHAIFLAGIAPGALGAENFEFI